MSRREKLIKRFLSCPKDFTWEELKALLSGFGFEEISFGKTGGSRRRFINEYIFPNARVWDYDQVPLHNKDIKTLNRWYINGLNYAKTLKAWLDNFDRHQEQIKTLNYGMDYAKFRRIWRLYLLWCNAYFSACNGEMLGNGQYLLSR
jgi:cyclopropane fatty-acyl-phospholipid synthase-like methyltransferase